jgi:hypothetical protein
MAWQSAADRVGERFLSTGFQQKVESHEEITYSAFTLSVCMLLIASERYSNIKNSKVMAFTRRKEHT